MVSYPTVVHMPKVVPGYKEAAKSKIIETAYGVFTQKGFDDSTMDDVAKRIGVTKGALYQYFESKDDLLEAIFPMTQRMFREALVRSFEGRTFVDGMRGLLDWIADEYSRNYGVLFAWLAGASRKPGLKKLLDEEVQQDLQILEEFIEGRSQKGGPRTKAEIRAQAEFLETMLVGTWVRIAMGEDKSVVLGSLKDVGALVEGRR